MKYHYVYRITNLIDRKHYYGSRSSNVSPEHDLGVIYFSSSSDSSFLQEQYDHPLNFRYKVVKQFGSRQAALEYEVMLHQKFQVDINEQFYNKSKQTSTKFSYNSSGYVFTDEHRKRLSESAKKRPPASAETRKRLSESLSGMNNPMYGKSQELNPFYGRKHTKESRDAMSQSQTGKRRSDETKQKITNALIGNKYRLGTTQSDDTKEKIRNAMQGRRASEESKKKMSEARKLFWQRKKGLL